MKRGGGGMLMEELGVYIVKEEGGGYVKGGTGCIYCKGGGGGMLRKELGVYIVKEEGGGYV